MSIPLIRNALRDPFEQARDAHVGLLLQRGYVAHETGENGQTRTAHIRRLCAVPASSLYRHAYQRWERTTADPGRFGTTVLHLQSRLFIGLAGSGMLETGCAIQHSYGVPYIPGSSVKGVVNAYVRHTGLDGELCDEIFGAPAAATGMDDGSEGWSGLIAFHDAWWVPGSALTPLVEEVVTSHHHDYYAREGMTEATDLDSPVPNAQLAVRGRFLFTLEGSCEWLEPVLEMLETALCEWGIGAKTRAGYGLCAVDEQHKAARQAQRRGWAAALQAEAEAQAAAEGARQEAARREALTEAARLLEDTAGAFSTYRELGEVARRQERSGFLGNLKTLLRAAADWPDASDRRLAADLLVSIYDDIGWADPGQKKARRDKQSAKRRGEVEALRQP